RGVLSQLMAAMHDDARDRGEPAAILTASEGSIYGRFGYGVAAWRLGVSAERARIAFARPDDDSGCTRLAAREEAELALPPIYDRARAARAQLHRTGPIRDRDVRARRHAVDAGRRSDLGRCELRRDHRGARRRL